MSKHTCDYCDFEFECWCSRRCNRRDKPCMDCGKKIGEELFMMQIRDNKYEKLEKIHQELILKIQKEEIQKSLQGFIPQELINIIKEFIPLRKFEFNCAFTLPLFMLKKNNPKYDDEKKEDDDEKNDDDEKKEDDNIDHYVRCYRCDKKLYINYSPDDGEPPMCDECEKIVEEMYEQEYNNHLQNQKNHS